MNQFEWIYTTGHSSGWDVSMKRKDGWMDLILDTVPEASIFEK